MEYDVFISYSRKDSRIVDQFVRQLADAGYRVWIDREGIHSGDEFTGIIAKAIKSSTLVIFFSSVNSNASEWTVKEISYALKKKKTIIPIRLDDTEYEDTIDLLLTLIDYIPYNSQNPSKSIERLISALQHKLKMIDFTPSSPEESTSSQTEPIVSILPIEMFTVNGVSFNMVRVEGGSFMMGATPEQKKEAKDDEKPVHKVTLSSYYIGETPVTRELWHAVMDNDESNDSGRTCPVDNVSWNDCQDLIANLNEITGRNFRLPTEAEWEFAARGGNKSKGFKYSGSNDTFGLYYTAGPVGERKANELGIHDMTGIVSEWCQDYYGMYKGDDQFDPMGPLSGESRVCRGGKSHMEGFLRVSSRDYYYPSVSLDNLGLRLAL